MDGVDPALSLKSLPMTAEYRKGNRDNRKIKITKLLSFFSAQVSCSYVFRQLGHFCLVIANLPFFHLPTDI